MFDHFFRIKMISSPMCPCDATLQTYIPLWLYVLGNGTLWCWRCFHTWDDRVYYASGDAGMKAAATTTSGLSNRKFTTDDDKTCSRLFSSKKFAAIMTDDIVTRLIIQIQYNVKKILHQSFCLLLFPGRSWCTRNLPQKIFKNSDFFFQAKPLKMKFLVISRIISRRLLTYIK